MASNGLLKFTKDIELTSGEINHHVPILLCESQGYSSLSQEIPLTSHHAIVPFTKFDAKSIFVYRSRAFVHNRMSQPV